MNERIHKVKCPKCYGNLIIDDIDFNFKGNENDYCICEKCNSSIFIKIRYGKVCKVEIIDKE